MNVKNLSCIFTLRGIIYLILFYVVFIAAHGGGMEDYYAGNEHCI